MEVEKIQKKKESFLKKIFKFLTTKLNMKDSILNKFVFKPPKIPCKNLFFFNIFINLN